MSLGARGGAKGGAGAKGSGKDRHPEKKDKPQPKEKVKPQATTEQIRLANMIDRKTSDDGADVRKMVQDLMEMTCRTEEEVCSALHDSDNDMVAACNILLETEKTQGEWQTSEKKKKKPPQPLNNGEAAPSRERERGPPGSRPRRGEGERGERGERSDRGERTERGRGAGRGGRGGGRGGRGGPGGRGFGGRGPPRNRDNREHEQGHYVDTNQMGDAFPATEDWDNEEWSGSLSDTKVFTPSAAALPPSEPEGAMLPPTEDWDSPTSVSGQVAGTEPHMPAYSYHNAAQHHVNMEQLNSGSRGSPATPASEQLPPEHYLHQIQHTSVQQPMGMSGSLTAAQSQYLSQLTQQSQREAIVYSSNYGVYGTADMTSQRKPQRARVPPPSKIPSSAVEMPGGELPGNMFLDVQFGALEPDTLRDTPHKPITQSSPHVAPATVVEETAPPPPPTAAPTSVPTPCPPPSTQVNPQVYSQHIPMQQQLNESLSSVESTSTPQVPVTSEPVVTSNSTSSLEKQLNASMKQLSVNADNSVPQHQPYVSSHRPKVGVAGPGNVYAAHPPPSAVYGASVYAPTAPQVNSTNASLSAAGGALTGGYPSSVTLTQYQPVLNSYQQTSSSNVPGVYNNSTLYTAPAPAPAVAAPYSYQPLHHKHKDTQHQYDSNSTGASSSLSSTSTTQTSSAKVSTSSAPAPAQAPAPAPAPAPAYAQQGALYGSQGYAYDDQLMRSTMPHHMGGYYEVGYGVSGGREGAFGLSAGERFSRTDAASPQQVPAAALPPGYAYFYQPPPPTTYQYGVYPTYGGGSNVGGVGGVTGGKVGNYAQQQQQPQYDTQDTYKTGGGYAGTGSKAGVTANTDLTNAMYAKTHVTLNKVNSYEKATFHSGTPPPFSASHLYITAPPHHHHVPHQMDVRMNSSHNRRQEAGSTGGRASSNKTAHSKPSYSHSYWPPN